MRTIAGPNTNALRSITGYNVGSPLRMAPMPTRPAQQIKVNTQVPQLRTNTGSTSGSGGGGGMSAGQAMGAANAAVALGTDISAIASDQIPAQSAKGEGGRILGETAKYAGMGMAFGPIGAGVGALVGLTVGLVKNKKAKEAHKEQMAANDKANKANAAQLALAANVNSQKAPATMKSPNEKSKAPNKRMEPLKRTMAPVKMAPLKRELSSMQANSSYMRTPASAVKRQEIMRTLSGASALMTNVGVTDGGKRFIVKQGQTIYDTGTEAFNQQYKKTKFKRDKELDNKDKQEFAKNNPELAATVSAENLKNKTEKEKAKIIADYRNARKNSSKEIAEN